MILQHPGINSNCHFFADWCQSGSCQYRRKGMPFGLKQPLLGKGALRDDPKQWLLRRPVIAIGILLMHVIYVCIWNWIMVWQKNENPRGLLFLLTSPLPQKSPYQHFFGSRKVTTKFPTPQKSSDHKFQTLKRAFFPPVTIMLSFPPPFGVGCLAKTLLTGRWVTLALLAHFYSVNMFISQLHLQ